MTHTQYRELFGGQAVVVEKCHVVLLVERHSCTEHTRSLDFPVFILFVWLPYAFEMLPQPLQYKA